MIANEPTTPSSSFNVKYVYSLAFWRAFSVRQGNLHTCNNQRGVKLYRNVPPCNMLTSTLNRDQIHIFLPYAGDMSFWLYRTLFEGVTSYWHKNYLISINLFEQLYMMACTFLTKNKKTIETIFSNFFIYMCALKYILCCHTWEFLPIIFDYPFWCAIEENWSTKSFEVFNFFQEFIP